MDKVLVQLFIPVTGKTYDIKLPLTISVYEAAGLIASFFTENRGGAYFPDEAAALCDMETGKIYDINSSVYSLHLKNGSKLMLI